MCGLPCLCDWFAGRTGAWCFQIPQKLCPLRETLSTNNPVCLRFTVIWLSFNSKYVSLEHNVGWTTFSLSITEKKWTNVFGELLKCWYLNVWVKMFRFFFSFYQNIRSCSTISTDDNFRNGLLIGRTQPILTLCLWFHKCYAYSV